MEILKNLINFDLEDLFWNLKYGPAQKKGTIYDLRKSEFKTLPPPVFFLSTGRAGTAWFSKLISKDKSVKVLHNPAPNLALQGKLAFQYLSEKDVSDTHSTLLKEIYLAGRENDLRYSFKTQRRIMETNNGISFFAPVLAELFPDAKFVHLVRHPLEFIESGLKRNYYTNSVEDSRRLNADDFFNSQDHATQISKIAWLWFTTNDFIRQLSKKNAHKFFLFPFHNLELKSIRELLTFLEVNVSDTEILKMIGKPVNVQKKGEAKSFNDWSNIEKEYVEKLCLDLSEELEVPLSTVSSRENQI